MNRPDVLVVGEALIDVVEESTGRQRLHPGGSPANVALGLARLGHPVELATHIGSDPHGHLIHEHLRRSGVRLAPGSVADGPTSTATATLDRQGGASYRFAINWDPPAVHGPGGPGHLHTGSIATALEPGCARVWDMVGAARANCTISYDPNLRPALLGPPGYERPGVERLVALADLVKASEEDLAWLHPGEDPADVAARWARSGPAMVVLTRGGQGSTVHWGPAGRRDLPARRVEVADTIGAGDAFMAGLLAGLLTAGLLGSNPSTLRAAMSGTELDPAVAAALDLAALTAAITCSRPGADPPLLAEVLAA